MAKYAHPWKDGRLANRANPVWSEKESELLMQFAGLLSAQDIADCLQRSLSTIKKWAARLGVSLAYSIDRKEWSASELQLLKRINGRLHHKDTAELMGRKPKSILNMQHKLGIRSQLVGELRGTAKYTDRDVELCRSLKDSGLPLKLIAEKMEIPFSTVRWWVYFQGRKAPTPERLSVAQEGM